MPMHRVRAEILPCENPPKKPCFENTDLEPIANFSPDRKGVIKAEYSPASVVNVLAGWQVVSEAGMGEH